MKSIKNWIVGRFLLLNGLLYHSWWSLQNWPFWRDQSGLAGHHPSRIWYKYSLIHFTITNSLNSLFRFQQHFSFDHIKRDFSFTAMVFLLKLSSNSGVSLWPTNKNSPYSLSKLLQADTFDCCLLGYVNPRIVHALTTKIVTLNVYTLLSRQLYFPLIQVLDTRSKWLQRD